jgi:hypothetical protein
LFIDGGVLSDAGIINANVNFVAGTISPGNSPDTLDISGVLFIGSGSIFYFEYAGYELGLFDQIRVSGDLFFEDSAILNLMFLEICLYLK